MKFCYDTEFIEKKGSIQLISIGIVAENGDEYYAVSSDMPAIDIGEHDWLCRNVVPLLPVQNAKWLANELKRPAPFTEKDALWFDLDKKSSLVKPEWVIANEVRDFLLADGGKPELWAYYSAYDHVVLMWLWGVMVNKPKGLPMYTKDLQQEIDRLGIPYEELPKQEGSAHNALDDARWNWEVLRMLEARGA